MHFLAGLALLALGQVFREAAERHGLNLVLTFELDDKFLDPAFVLILNELPTVADRLSDELRLADYFDALDLPCGCVLDMNQTRVGSLWWMLKKLRKNSPPAKLSVKYTTSTWSTSMTISTVPAKLAAAQEA